MENTNCRYNVLCLISEKQHANMEYHLGTILGGPFYREKNQNHLQYNGHVTTCYLLAVS